MDKEQQLPLKIQELISFIGSKVFVDNPVFDSKLEEATFDVLRFALKKVGKSPDTVVCNTVDYYLVCVDKSLIVTDKKTNKLAYINSMGLIKNFKRKEDINE